MHGTHDLRRRIGAGEPSLGAIVPLGLDFERLRRLWSRREYDLLFVDGQHYAVDESRLVQLCDHADRLGAPVVFRIAHPRATHMIGHWLDLGASGIEVPLVEDEPTARGAIDEFYYPGLGRRSFGGSHRVRWTEHSERRRYADWWNEHGLLWLQVESLGAVMRAPSLGGAGITCLSWGPIDLGFDRERHPDHPLKTDDDCLRHVAECLRGGPTRLCVRCEGPHLRAKYRELGATVLLEPARHEPP